ncbi:MAG: hypothetical protein HY231_25710 [Acidobacteria bacterium]|nr:hypothetical protein [Acidobacteriota bacterium]
MKVTEIFCGGFLLSAIGGIGVAMSRAQFTLEETSIPTETEAVFPPTHDIETWRAIHGVSLLAEKDEGYGVARLPNGVYGFSWSP